MKYLYLQNISVIEWVSSKWMILNVYLFDQEKLERLYELDRMLQEQSFKVTSLQEDKVSCCLLLL